MTKSEYSERHKRQCIHCAAGVPMTVVDGYHCNGGKICTAKPAEEYIAELEQERDRLRAQVERLERELAKVADAITRAEVGIERKDRRLDDWLCQVLQALVMDAGNVKLLQRRLATSEECRNAQHQVTCQLRAQVERLTSALDRRPNERL